MTRENIGTNITHKIRKKLSLAFDYDGSKITFLDEKSSSKIISIYVSFVFVLYFLQKASKLPFYKTTICGNTSYAYLMAKSIKSNYIFCRNYKNNAVLETDDNKYLQIYGPSQSLHNEEKLFVKLNPNEIKKLENHCKISGLEEIQEEIIREYFPNAYNNLYINDSLFQGDMNYSSVVTKLIKISDDLFYVENYEKCWLSRLILTDVTEDIKNNDILACRKKEIITLDEVVKNNVDYSSCSLNMYNEKQKIIYSFDFNYKYDKKMNLLRKISPFDIDTDNSIFFLSQPRNLDLSSNNRMISLHPFNLPQNWNIFLTIMILSRYLINKFNL